MPCCASGERPSSVQFLTTSGCVTFRIDFFCATFGCVFDRLRVWGRRVSTHVHGKQTAVVAVDLFTCAVVVAVAVASG